MCRGEPPGASLSKAKVRSEPVVGLWLDEGIQEQAEKNYCHECSLYKNDRSEYINARWTRLKFQELDTVVYPM